MISAAFAAEIPNNKKEDQMALSIALVAKNPFSLSRAREAFVQENAEDVLVVSGMKQACQIQMRDGCVIKLLSESDWRNNRWCREELDQIFVVGPELLGVDFMLELQECLKGSCVPEAWQWQKWRNKSGQY